MLGTIDGIKATLYVTNVGSLPTPMVQFLVCDTRGVKVGTASKTGTPLAAGAEEKIEILATNLNAADQIVETDHREIKVGFHRHTNPEPPQKRSLRG